MITRVRRILGNNGTFMGGKWCIYPVIQNGNLVGTDEPATNITPELSLDGVNKWYSLQADTTTGDIIAKFGDSGTSKIDNEDSFRILINNTLVLLTWEESNLYYIGNDQSVADYLLAEVGNEVCFESEWVHPFCKSINASNDGGDLRGYIKGGYGQINNPFFVTGEEINAFTVNVSNRVLQLSIVGGGKVDNKGFIKLTAEPGEYILPWSDANTRYELTLATGDPLINYIDSNQGRWVEYCFEPIEALTDNAGVILTTDAGEILVQGV